MRIALTGSTGLIGGGIYEHLCSAHQILRIGRRSQCDLRADLADQRSVAALDLKGCQALIHCAGVVDMDFVTNPTRAWAQAVFGAEELARRAHSDGVERVIYFSAAHVYGTLRGIVSEDKTPDPLTHYAMAHYITEQIFKSYSRKGLKVIIVRPNAVYGVPTSWEGFDRWEIIPYDFPLQAVYRQKIVLRSTGEQIRNFIALADLADYVERLLTIQVPENVFLLNAVGRENLRVVDFAHICAKICEEVTGKPCHIEKPSGSMGYVDDYQPVTKHAQFIPTRHVEDFVRDFTKQITIRSGKGEFYGNHR